ncbi:hypothetical protein HYY74_05035 [Candidatus Woesearchaeota archaeon]|nr:hypothetical protein [Candidatus Woesearchaeota archaeon]
MKDIILSRLEAEHYGVNAGADSGKRAVFRQHIGKRLRHMQKLQARGEELFETRERAMLAAEAAARALRRHEHDYAHLLKIHSRRHFHSIMSGSQGREELEMKHAFRNLSQLLIQQATAAERLAANLKAGRVNEAVPLYRELLEAAREEWAAAKKTEASSLLAEHEQSLSRAMAAASNPFAPTHIP